MVYVRIIDALQRGQEKAAEFVTDLVELSEKKRTRSPEPFALVFLSITG